MTNARFKKALAPKTRLTWNCKTRKINDIKSEASEHFICYPFGHKPTAFIFNASNIKSKVFIDSGIIVNNKNERKKKLIIKIVVL